MTRDCGPFTKSTASCSLGTQLSAEGRHYRSRETARRWIEEQVRSKNNFAEVRASTCQIQVLAPQRSAVISIRSRCRAERLARYSDTAAVEIPDLP
ncbi:unnamed protein product, partial [Staurois parvus]